MTDFQLDFVGVGAAKAATTWLHECLRQHPQICMSEPKGLSYFCTRDTRPNVPVNNDRDDSWLESRFSHCEQDQIRGEISVRYLNDPASPQLIARRCPNAKIIVSYRNPVDALYSLYYQWAKEFPVPDSFDGFIRQYPEAVESGFYYTHTKRYLCHFPRDHMHFIVFDDIREDPERVLGDLFEFLGVSPGFLPDGLRERVNRRKSPRSFLLRDFIGSTRDYLNSHPRLCKLKGLLTALGAEAAVSWLYRINLRPASFPAMDDGVKAHLAVIYADEIMKLSNLLDRDLSHWIG